MNLEKWLEHDGVVILISVIVASVLWLQVNIIGGTELSRTFSGIPVTVHDAPEGSVITLLDPETVAITVRGERQLIRELQPEDFAASVDLSGVAPVENDLEDLRLPVHVEVPRGADLTGFTPATARLVLEAIRERAVPVEVLVANNLGDDRRLGSPTVEPAEVTVRGTASRVDRVVLAAGNLSVDAADSSVVRAQVPLIPVDAEDEQVADVEVIPDRADVTIPVEDPEPDEPNDGGPPDQSD